MRRLAFHNCVCHSYFRDVELLTRGDILLQALGNRTPGGLLIVECEEHFPSLGILHKVELCSLVVSDEFDYILPADDADISHDFVCTLKE